MTELIHEGDNAIGAWLGDGWYRGRLGWNGGFRNLFGDDLSFIGQLEIVYADGRRDTIATGPGWSAATGPILRTGIYDGEDYDARDERPGWSSADFDVDGWAPVAVHRRDPATLVAPEGPPVALHPGGRPGRGAHDSERQAGARPGPEPRGPHPDPRRRTRGHDRHDPHGRGAAGGRDLHPPAARGEVHRQLHTP